MNLLRSLSQEEAGQWVELIRLLQGVKLNEPRDKMGWMLEKSRKYSTKSMYHFLLHRGGCK
jgi:hypothetical protein